MKKITLALFVVLIASCSSTKVDNALHTQSKQPIKGVTTDKKKGVEAWAHSDGVTYPGMRLDAAYQFLNGKKSSEVIVGVIDSGIDINHEDLKDVIWVNTKEIPGNGIDDDHNGYVDDVYGWNFLGDINQANLESVRMMRKCGVYSQYKDEETGKILYSDMFLNEDVDCEVKEYYGEETMALSETEGEDSFIFDADNFIQRILRKENYSLRDIMNSPDVKDILSDYGARVLIDMLIENENHTIQSLREQFADASNYAKSRVNYHLNPNFDPRKEILKDDEDDFTKTSYGNNNVIGPELKEALHGTHVAGIIAAKRNNSIGMNGVADNVKIMCIRAVPDGDEYDKDVALAIRYATDNGAKVINTSFGKPYSPHWQKVHEAIKYAASRDVLIVNAAGNDAKNIDEVATYPNDDVNGREIADNMITVGALNYKYGKDIVAKFSNYGKRNVDIFAPGVKIYSTVPSNKYDFLSGTSMAAPEVAGLAALIRSYFPNLTASEVKKAILNSGSKVFWSVKKPHKNSNQEAEEGEEEEFSDVDFANLSKTGAFIDAYNAVKLASQMSDRKQ